MTGSNARKNLRIALCKRLGIYAGKIKGMAAMVAQRNKCQACNCEDVALRHSDRF